MSVIIRESMEPFCVDICPHCNTEGDFSATCRARSTLCTFFVFNGRSVCIQDKPKPLSQDTKEVSEKIQLNSSAFPYFTIRMVTVAFAFYCLGCAVAGE